ncbi:family 61 glycoside hydrolase [Peziza echinospora]|nr:family 61 glycoside hydrolase [Peziza echinospora]
MKLLSLSVASAALLQVASAHYRFTSLIVNGQVTSPYQYVRQNTNMNSPVYPPSNDLRCNTGGASGSNTQTATVAAGSTVGFALDQAIFHIGPTIAYISKAPSLAANYDGSGTWTKIYQVPPVFSGGQMTWPSDNKSQFTFKLPQSLAPGEYLLRIEHIALHGMPAQFYISCAQIKVTGSGSSLPGAGISLPSGYPVSHPGITINVYYPIPTSYTMPGGPVWSG